jgi:hypothetical protein
MRMRLGLLQDPAVIDRQIKKEMQLAETARQKAATPTVRTEAEMKAEEALTEKEREAIRKKAEDRTKPRIRPLSEQKAIEMGANFAAETFIFAVGIGVIVFEQWRQRRKARNARDDIREDLEEMQNELKVVKAELEEWKTRHPEPASSGGLLGYWKGGRKTEEKKEQEKKEQEKRTVTPDTPATPPTTQTLKLEPSSKPSPPDVKEAPHHPIPKQTDSQQ